MGWYGAQAGGLAGCLGRCPTLVQLPCHQPGVSSESSWPPQARPHLLWGCERWGVLAPAEPRDPGTLPCTVCTVEQVSACLLKGEFVPCAAVQPQRPRRKIGLNLTPELLPRSPHSWSRACRRALGFTARRSATSRRFVPVRPASRCLSSLLNAGWDASD